MRELMVAILALCTVVPQHAHAEPVVWAICGPFESVSQVVQGHGVNNVEVGGKTPNIAGETMLIHDADRPEVPFDVVHDGDEGTTSLAGTGARIVAVELDDGGVVLAAVSTNGAVETFHFLGTILVFTLAQNNDGHIATSTYSAACRWLN